MANASGEPEKVGDDFERELRNGFGALGRDRGACLREDVLERLLHGGLSAAEIASARAHIGACGLCELRLANLESIVAPPESGFRRIRIRAWRVMMHPAFAYALLLLVAVPSVIRIWPRKAVVSGARVVPPVPVSFSVNMPVEPAIEGVPVINLNRERGSDNGTSAAVLAVPTAAEAATTGVAGGGFFALAFYYPEIRGHHYLAEVVSQAGGAHQTVRLPTVRLATSDGMGNFQLLCRRASFPRGSYTLKVWDEGRTSSEGDEYGFEVR